MTTLTTKRPIGCGLLLLPIIILSCHVTRSVTTSHVATDSAVTHVRDSARSVINELNMEHWQQIRQIASSGVTFDKTPCPDLSQFRASLDSIGKINFDLAITKDSIIQSLRNKVSIDRNGAIKAEGAISAAYRTNSMITEENSRLTKVNDSLGRVVDSQKVALSRTSEVKVKEVERKFIPWWIFLLMAGIAVSAYAVAWWRHHGRLV